MKNTLLAAVKKRFSYVEKNPLYCIASLLDPRYTDRFFSNTNTAREAKVMVIQELQKMSGWGQQEEHEEPPIRRLRRDQPSSSLDSVFDEIADEHVSLSSTPVAAAIQLEIYLAEATVSREDKPLHDPQYRGVPVAWPTFTSSGHQYLEMNDKINRDSVQQKLRIRFVHYWTETSVSASSSGGLVDITRNFPGPFEGILFSTATACTVGSRMPGRCS
ncbi:hypothetical protein AAFF_G00252350 [Aldrovandia affinis]|uniref:Uncharacterized protein n=1 Tax=Aldrovandia affinis TaxID=143900 RepID=A0AAD7WTN1_9TELE|nr:hypothetical protein AAFF_G00252350 [Aldrovandia affinis]